MNKKFFSAVLMGALLLGGTFVSCQDYDDDIENLQNQIDKLASADQLSSKVSELQSAISAAQSAAEAKAAAANTVAEAAKKAAGDADAKAAAAQKAADDVKAAAEKAGDDASKEAKAAAAAAQKVADDLKAALEGALTEADVNAAIDTALKAALEKYATVEALQEVADELAKIQEAIAKCATDEDLQKLAEKVAALEGDMPVAVVPVASVNAPASQVKVNFEWAHWNKMTSVAKAELYEQIYAAYPEAKLDTLKKGQLVKQGGHLPVIVNPANVKLNDDYNFVLQAMEGSNVDVAISNPTAGLIGATPLFQNVTSWATVPGWWGNMTVPVYTTVLVGMETKAVDANASIWTLAIEPAVGKDKKYKDFTTSLASLAIENEDGTVVRTPYAYQIVSNEIKATANVTIEPEGLATYAPEIDLLAPTAENPTVAVQIKNGYKGYQIIDIANAYEKRKYGLDVKDNHILVIKNMPTDVPYIAVRLDVIALGLNGSIAQQEVTVRISQQVAADAALTSDTITLNGKTQKALYSVEELGIADEVVMDNILRGTLTVTATRVNDAGSTETIFNGTPTFYTKNGTATEYNTPVKNGWSKGEPEYIGFTINAKTANTGCNKVAADEYTVEFVSKTGTADDAATLLKATSTLVTELPSDLTPYIKIAAAYKEGTDTVRIVSTGFTANTAITALGGVKFSEDQFKKTFVLYDGTTINKFVDAEYDADYAVPGNEALASYWNYIGSDRGLAINAWKYSTVTGFIKAKDQQMYNARKMVAKVNLWGNDNLVADYNFNMVAKSSIYAEDAVKAGILTFKADDYKETTEKNINYGGTATFEVDKAFYAAGVDKGNEYNLFGNGKTTADATYEIKDNQNLNYEEPKTESKYVLDSDGNPVVIAKSDWRKLGLTLEQYMQLDTMKVQPTFYMLADGYHYTVEFTAGKSPVVELKANSAVSSSTPNDNIAVLAAWKDVLDVVLGRDGDDTKVINRANAYYQVIAETDVTNKLASDSVGSTLPIKVDDPTSTSTPKAKINKSALSSVSTKDKNYVALFESYIETIAFEKNLPGRVKTQNASTGIKQASEIVAIKLVIDEFDEAKKYVTTSETTVIGVRDSKFSVVARDKATLDAPFEDVTVNCHIEILDVWGLVTKYPLKVNIKTKTIPAAS